MIEAKNVHKFYGNLHVLKGVDLKIMQGEVVSIVGESGAGKSTLLQILGSLDRPTDPKKYHTSVTMDGAEYAQLNDKNLSNFRNKNIGFIFQYHNLLPEFTAWENVMIPIRIAKLPIKDFEDRAHELFKDLNISLRMQHKPRQLSGGEAQRVAVARALIHQPKVIFADEPTGNLDSKNADDLHDLFFRLRDKYNQTFVIVTHNNKLADLTDRKLKMYDGLITN